MYDICVLKKKCVPGVFIFRDHQFYFQSTAADQKAYIWGVFGTAFAGIVRGKRRIIPPNTARRTCLSQPRATRKHRFCTRWSVITEASGQPLLAYPARALGDRGPKQGHGVLNQNPGLLLLWIRYRDWSPPSGLRAIPLTTRGEGTLLAAGANVPPKIWKNNSLA